MKHLGIRSAQSLTENARADPLRSHSAKKKPHMEAAHGGKRTRLELHELPTVSSANTSGVNLHKEHSDKAL